MTSNLKQTNGWAHNGVFYTTEREALLSALTTEEDYPVNKAILYSDGSVLVMNNANVVIDRFVDRFTKLTPTEYETNYEEEDDKQNYWALNEDGLLYIIGRYENYEGADIEAEKMGLRVLWLIDQETANSWRDTLT